MDWSGIAAVAASVAAGGSVWTAYLTRKLVDGQLATMGAQLATAKEQVKIQLYLELRREFDSGRMMTARKLLASQLLANAPHVELQEDVMNFFQDLGMLGRRGYLDQEMMWSTFSYYARMWWSACKDYVVSEREEKGEDQTLFTDFQYLAEQICELEAKKREKQRAALEPSAADVKTFLEEEAGLSG